MREVVIISGKGGTGKTSVTASFAALAAGGAVLADCDVDAADLHRVLTPRILRREVFVSGHEAVIREADCTGCGLCLEACRFEAVRKIEERGRYAVDAAACEGCGVCVRVCPVGAVDFPERTCGEWFVSETRAGPMVHARLGIAAENSGKLVSLVREEARRIARERGLDLVLVDGPPGVGCPVIASVTGAALVVVVTEPTRSGEHDLLRVLALTRHFSIRAAVAVNKWDLNPRMADLIEKGAAEAGATVLPRITYDQGVTRALVRGKTAVEAGGPAAEDITKGWRVVCGLLAKAA